MTWLRGVLSGRGGVDLWPMDCIPIWFPKGFMPAMHRKKREFINIYIHTYTVTLLNITNKNIFYFNIF